MPNQLPPASHISLRMRCTVLETGARMRGSPAVGRPRRRCDGAHSGCAEGAALMGCLSQQVHQQVEACQYLGQERIYCGYNRLRTGGINQDFSARERLYQLIYQ